MPKRSRASVSRLAGRVPDCDGEHPAQPLPEAGAPLLVAMHEHLGVAVRPKDVAGPLEFAGELAIVVDLAVLDDDDAAVFAADRLVAAGQVDDREAPRGDPDPAVDVHALRVGAAVDERRRHPAEPLAVDGAAVEAIPQMPHMADQSAW